MHDNNRSEKRTKNEKQRHMRRYRISLILTISFGLTFIISATMLVLHYAQLAREDKALRELAAAIPDANITGNSTGNTTEKSVSTGDTEVQLQPNQPPAILERYRKLHEQNTDMVGWIRIDGTRINYPVMYTGDDFYLSHGFDKKNSKSGVPFIDKRCTVNPFGTNTIIYGHHMRNGTMFADLLKYADKEFFTEHPIIQFDTLYEQQKYEIIAVFRSQIYNKNDEVFKFYNFINADNATAFDDYINNIKELSLYDTGVTASYGDELLTLVTCSYHTRNGQFVVVARKQKEQPLFKTTNRIGDILLSYWL
jgi:sortase B